MRNRIKALATVALLTFATSVWANSGPLSLGSRGAESTMEINLLTNYMANVTLYCNGEAVFVCDTGGVTYAAPGIYWYANGTDYMVYNLPEGDYSADMDCITSGSYSMSYDSIQWIASGGYFYALVEFY